MKKQLLILLTLFTVTMRYSQMIGDTFVENFITYEVTSITPNTVELTDYDHNNGGIDVDIPATVINSGTTYSATCIGSSAFEHIPSSGKYECSD